jgi:1-acyl-sn-glycerol-3-phosphate acyltransferase
VQFRFLAKKGLFSIPFLGWHLKDANHISVALKEPHAAIRTLNRTAELIETRGISVLFFPEGGRSMDGELKEFKDGAAYIAIKAQAPMVPLALLGAREILPMGSGTIRSGLVRLRIGDPISTAGMASREDRRLLTEAARRQIVEMLSSPRVPPA